MCEKRQGDGKLRTFYKCGKPTHIARDFGPKDLEPAIEKFPVTLPSALLTVPNFRKSNGCSTRHARANIANDRSYFIDFFACKGIVQDGNNEVTRSPGHGTVRVTKIFQKFRHQITMQDVVFAPNIMFNLISASRVRKNSFHINIVDD